MASVHDETSVAAPSSFQSYPREASPLRIARLIEGEIIPRIVLAHRNDAATPLRPSTAPATISRADTETIADMTLNVEVFELIAHAERYLERGVSIESIYLDLLAPAARTLGSWWDDDMCDFIDVTMGLWRLQQVVHELGVRAPCPSVRTRADRRVLFTVPPGDQHSFGLVMIEEFFRRAGWRTWSAPDAGLADLNAIVGRKWFELIGLTVSNVEHLANLPDIICALRGASQNPAVGVMVGGQIFSENPALADGSGADATAADGTSALVVAERLVEQLLHR